MLIYNIEVLYITCFHELEWCFSKFNSAHQYPKNLQIQHGHGSQSLPSTKCKSDQGTTGPP